MNEFHRMLADVVKRMFEDKSVSFNIWKCFVDLFLSQPKSHVIIYTVKQKWNFSLIIAIIFYYSWLIFGRFVVYEPLSQV